MKGKAIVPLVLGLGMGFMAIKMGMNMINKARGANIDTVDVVVAARPIEAASRVDKSMLRIAPVPRTLVPPGVFAKPEQLEGRVSLMQVATGLPVSNEMLAPVGSEPGLPSQIPAGHRALSVKVDESTAVGGFVMPGHHVDIYSVETPRLKGGKLGNPISKLLLEDIQVGAVGQSIKTVDPDGKSTKLTRSVTLYVRPEDIPSVDLASRGTIRLVLRGSHEAKPSRKPKIGEGLAKLFGAFQDMKSPAPQPKPQPVVMTAPPPEPEPTPADPYVVEVYRGREVSEVAFVSPESSVKFNSGEGRSVGGGRPSGR